MIASQVIQYVVEAPLVVADLTGRNPNVFYELALRHALRKPLVQLIQKGEEIPFDVAGTRTIYIDHRDLATAATAREKIIEQINAIHDGTSDVETPISVSMDLQLLRQSGKPQERSLAELRATVVDMQTNLSKLDSSIATLSNQQNALVQELKVVRKMPASSPPGEDQSYTYLAGRYGMGYDLLEVECIIDDQGAATIWRTTALRARSGLGSLDTYLLIPETTPSGGPRNIDQPKVKSLTTGWEVSVGSIRREKPSKLAAEIDIFPPLKPEELLVFQMVEELPDQRTFAIGLNEGEISRRQEPLDYFGWNINRPTKHLALRVNFPEWAAPTLYNTQVRYASTSGFAAQRLQPEEQGRLARPRLEDAQGNRRVLKLDVDYPVIGLIYELQWKPVPKTDSPMPPFEP